MRPNLTTVDQFERLPDDCRFCYELHFGRVAAVPWPNMGALDLRRRLVNRLRPKLAGLGQLGERLPYRALAEFDLRVADVGFVLAARWNAVDPETYLSGAPDLVIQLVPHDPEPLRETVSLCLNNGALECWLVDRSTQSVTVVRKDGTTCIYERHAEVPLTAFGSDALRVAEIFA